MTDTQYAGAEATSEEKTLGLFCHLSIFLGGIILPIIFWAMNKDKSKFVRFHSLQSIFFHLAYIVFIFIIVFVFVLLYALGIGVGVFSSAHGGHPDTGFSIFIVIAVVLFYIVLFGLIFGSIGYSIYMGVKTYQGKLVKYPIIGKMVYNKVYGPTGY